MTTLAILFGVAAIWFYFCARIQRDRYTQLHDLMELNLVQANIVLDHCNKLEQYNTHLESCHCHKRDVLAALMLFSPTPLDTTDKMTVKDGVEVP